MQKSKIKDSIKKLPDSPGVYLFKDKNNRVLYVGKAINIKKRVTSYFDKNKQELRTILLLKSAAKITYEKTASELEALLLEARLIKNYGPKFNIILKDDKRYLYLGIAKEKFGRVFLLRQPEKDTQLLDWFGPFPSAGSLKEVIRLLRRVFPFRSCRRLPQKTCLYYNINLCPGPCCYPNPVAYRKNINQIKSFMNGKIALLRRSLKKGMDQAIKNLNFEEAQIMKMQIQSVDNIIGRFKRLPEATEINQRLSWIQKVISHYQGIEPLLLHRIEAYDVANLGKKIVVGSMAVFIDGEPANSEYRQFKIRARFRGDPEGIKEIIQRRLKNHQWLIPQLILIDGGKPQISAAYQVLIDNQLHKKIALIGLVKGKEAIIIPISNNNHIVGWKIINQTSQALGLPILQHVRDEAHRFAQKYYRKLASKDLVGFLGDNKN